jgi:ElaB/YqjD/DUF883 family membrane-anchored ribosome-binding protein
MDNTVRGNNASNSGMSKDVDNALNKASSGAHAAVDSMAIAADEAARKAKPAIDKVASMAHQAVDKVAGATAPTAEWLAEQGDSLNAAQKKLVAGTCGYVSAHPLKAIGIAVLTGFLLSRFIR